MVTRSAKNLLRVSACALFLVAITGAPVSLAQQPVPKIVVSQTTYDFGNIFRGEGISYVFVIKNEGKADLVIEDFTPG